MRSNAINDGENQSSNQKRRQNQNFAFARTSANYSLDRTFSIVRERSNSSFTEISYLLMDIN